MKNFAIVSELDTRVVNVTIFEDEPAFDPPPGHIFVEMSEGDAEAGVGYTYADGVFSPPKAQAFIPDPNPPRFPVKRSKIEVRRLLKPKEALWFDNALAEPPMTLQAIDEAFDPNTTTTALQLEAMKRDAIFQWSLLPDLIEMNHDDTRDFMYVMGACGMFGADARTRIPRVLACMPPE